MWRPATDAPAPSAAASTTPTVSEGMSAETLILGTQGTDTESLDGQPLTPSAESLHANIEKMEQDMGDNVPDVEG